MITMEALGILRVGVCVCVGGVFRSLFLFLRVCICFCLCVYVCVCVCMYV